MLCNTWRLQQPDSERTRSSSRNGSSSKRPVVLSSRPSSSGEPSEIRSSRLVSSSSRLSTKRIQPGFESKSSLSRATGTRGGRDDALRSFELLSIGMGKRKWRSMWLENFASRVAFPSTTFLRHQELIYSLYFHPVLGPFRAKSSFEISSWSFGWLFLYLFKCPSVITSTWTHSWRDSMFRNLFVYERWLLVINTFSIFFWWRKGKKKKTAESNMLCKFCTPFCCVIGTWLFSPYVAPS